MIFKTPSSIVSSALQNRRQKKAAIQARRSQKNRRLNFDQLERRSMLTTFFVNTLTDDASGAEDGFISLREAIQASNTNQAFGDAPAGNADGDLIVFVASLTERSLTLLEGEFTITDDLIINGGSSGFTIDADSNSRHFNIATTETVGLTNLTLVNGNEGTGGSIVSLVGGTTRLTDVTLSGNTATGSGGAIFTGNNSSLFATRLVATGNESVGNGGAITQLDGEIGLFDSVIESNVAGISGGGIAIMDGTFFASNTTLGSPGAGNTAGSNGSGGGIFLTSGDAASFIGGSISSNTAQEGGGIGNVNADLFLSGVEIADNVATGAEADQGGGGIFNSTGDLRIANGTSITNNTAAVGLGSGGGILSADGEVLVLDSVVSTNTANRAGGGIEIINGDLFFRRSVLDGNIAGPAGGAAPGSGGGIHITGNDVSTFVQASTISNNFAALEGGGIWNQEGSFLRVDTGSLLINNVAAGILPVVDEDVELEEVVVTEEETEEEEIITEGGGGGIYNNGGGVTLINATLQGNTADGVFGDGGGLFSIAGNVFVNASAISDNNASRNGGGFEIVDGRLDVFNAIIQDNEAGFLDVDFAGEGFAGVPGDGGGIHVTGNETTTTFRGSLINGNSAANNGGGIYNPEGSTSLIASSTVVSENSAAGATDDNGGGGVFNDGGDLRILNASILSNSATGEFGGGGGIFSTDGRILINDSTINFNDANGNGGGFEIVEGFTRLEDTIVNLNSAGTAGEVLGNGGAVHVAGFDAQFVAIGSTFFGNQANGLGGAIWNNTGSLVSLQGSDRISGESRVNGNISGLAGGGVYNQGTLLATDTFFAGNVAGASGGGVFATETATSFLVDVIVQNNFALGSGGGLANFGELAVIDSFFASNDALTGGAIAGLGGVTSQGQNTFVANTPNNIFRA